MFFKEFGDPLIIYLDIYTSLLRTVTTEIHRNFPDVKSDWVSLVVLKGRFPFWKVVDQDILAVANQITIN